MKDGLYTRHEVACIIADLFGGTCACDYSGNDEWSIYEQNVFAWRYIEPFEEEE